MVQRHQENRKFHFRSFMACKSSVSKSAWKNCRWRRELIFIRGKEVAQLRNIFNENLYSVPSAPPRCNPPNPFYRNAQANLVLRCTSCQCHSNVRHRGIRRCTVPVFFAGFNMHDIADGDITLLVFRRDLSLSRRDDQNLIAIVNMPSRCCADAEIDHVAAEIVRLPSANNRLPRPAHHTATPSRYRRRRIHGFFVKFTNLEYAHLASLCSIAFAVARMAYAPSPIRHTYTASAESVNRPVDKVNLADLSCGNSFAGISIIY